MLQGLTNLETGNLSRRQNYRNRFTLAVELLLSWMNENQFFDVKKDAESTLEANPDDLTLEKFGVIHSCI